jgi:hypothetical protein
MPVDPEGERALTQAIVGLMETHRPVLGSMWRCECGFVPSERIESDLAQRQQREHVAEVIAAALLARVAPPAPTKLVTPRCEECDRPARYCGETHTYTPPAPPVEGALDVVVSGLKRLASDAGPFARDAQQAYAHAASLVAGLRRFHDAAYAVDHVAPAVLAYRPMPTDELPTDRDWTQHEWAMNQWWLANEQIAPAAPSADPIPPHIPGPVSDLDLLGADARKEEG